MNFSANSKALIVISPGETLGLYKLLIILLDNDPNDKPETLSFPIKLEEEAYPF